MRDGTVCDQPVQRKSRGLGINLTVNIHFVKIKILQIQN